MENNELQYQGLILDKNTISKADFKIGSQDNNLKIPENSNKKKFFYNQGKLKRTRNACGLFGTAGAVSDLTGYEFSEAELLEIVDLAEKSYGRTETGGMYMHKAVDCTRTYWNAKHPDQKIISFRTDLGNETFADGIKKGHSFVVGYRTSGEYYKDSQDDGVVKGEDFPKQGGHLVRANFNDTIKIDDNYFGTKKYNTYTNNKISKLKDNGVFFPSAYLFLFDTSIEDEIRNQIDLEGAKEMFDQGYWNGLNPRLAMSRQEVMTVQNRQRKEFDVKIKELKDIIDKLTK